MDITKKVITHKAYNPELSDKEIADDLNLQENDVKEILQQVKKLERDGIIKLYQDCTDVSAKQLAKVVGKSYQYVNRILKEELISVTERTKQLQKQRDEKLKQQILEMYEQKMFVKDILAKLGISPAKLNELRKELGIELISLRSKRQEDLVKHIQQRKAEGKTYREIAREVELSESYIYNLVSQMRKKGLEI